MAGLVEVDALVSVRLRLDCVSLVGKGLNGERFDLPCHRILAALSA
jgi:hypothetical protein